MGARVRQEFDWQGYHFSQGTWVLLDPYGTNRDSDLWERPNIFWPERFSYWQEDPFSFIPQSGGDYYTNHRCAGEWLTRRLIARSLRFLVNDLEYFVPAQNLDSSLSQIPALPKSRFLISGVKLH